jgi:hypothetical protein
LIASAISDDDGNDESSSSRSDGRSFPLL